jgi:signal peptidase I
MEGIFMKENVKQEIYSWIKAIAVAFILVFICRYYLFAPRVVFGESMAPTFQDKDKVVISKFNTIHRFDIIVFDAPDVEGEQYVKRVIGLPGDSVEMKDDILYINGQEVDEPYLNKEEIAADKLTGDFTLKEITGKSIVPQESYFVLGDNRLFSKDSRFFGFISSDSVNGEVKLRYYPLQKISIPK